MSLHLVAVLLVALGGALGGLLVPWLIARVPEPVPEADSESGMEADPELKERYVDIAGSPRLRLWTALVAGSTGALVGTAIGWSWLLVPWLLAIPVGVALAVIDWRTRLLPFRLTTPLSLVLLPVVLSACLLAGDWPDVWRSLVSGAGCFLFYFVLWFINPRGMGYGDVRLAFPLGLLLGAVGVAELLFGVWMAFVIGAVVGLARGGFRGMRGRHIPFGPFMLMGAVAGLLWGGVVLGGLAA